MLSPTYTEKHCIATPTIFVGAINTNQALLRDKDWGLWET